MQYQLFAIPIIVMLINQIIKLIVEVVKGEFKWPSMLSYGGMPSSHASIVTSLTIVMGYYNGIQSSEFAITIILAILIIRDASGIRLQLGNHGKILNQLIKELPDKKEYKFPVLNERFGHRNIEVIVGIILSSILTITLINIW